MQAQRTRSTRTQCRACVHLRNPVCVTVKVALLVQPGQDGGLVRHPEVSA